MSTIYVNARFLTQPMSGVQNFALNLCQSLKEKKYNVNFLTCQEVLHQSTADELGAIRIGKMKGHTWEQFELPLWLRKKGNPLLINLCNSAPVTYPHQFNTIHDLAFEQPEPWFSQRFRYFYRWMMPQVAKNCEKLITVSRFSSSEIQKIYGIPSSKIIIIPNVISREMATLMKTKNFQPPDDPYFLSVGSMDPRKNLKTIITAFLTLKKQGVRLKIAGKKNPVFKDPGLDEQYLKHPDIDWLYEVSNKELAGLYKNAVALVNVSLYEGFGLNNLEAMVCGCPLLLSDIPVFHEICGDAAVYVSPDDTNALSVMMEKFLDGTALLDKPDDYVQHHLKNFSREGQVQILLDEISRAGY